MSGRNEPSVQLQLATQMVHDAYNEKVRQMTDEINRLNAQNTSQKQQVR